MPMVGLGLKATEIEDLPGKMESSPSGALDDDKLPIGSLFRVKKPRPMKKAKPLESRVGSPKAAEKKVNSGELDDTLASLRKKLKGPKRSSNDVVVSASGGGVVDGFSENSLPKRPRRDRESLSGIIEGDGCFENSEGSSDGSLRDSLSAFILRSRSGSVSRVRPIKKRDNSVEVTRRGSDVGLKDADKVSNGMVPTRHGELRSVDGGDLSTSCTGLTKAPSGKKKGRKPRVLQEVEESNDSIGMHGKTPKKAGKRKMGTLVSADATGLEVETHVEPPLFNASLSPEFEISTVPERVHGVFDNGSNKACDLAMDGSALSKIEPSSSASVPEPLEWITTCAKEAMYSFSSLHDWKIRTCSGASSPGLKVSSKDTEDHFLKESSSMTTRHLILESNPSGAYVDKDRSPGPLSNAGDELDSIMRSSSLSKDVVTERSATSWHEEIPASIQEEKFQQESAGRIMDCDAARRVFDGKCSKEHCEGRLNVNYANLNCKKLLVEGEDGKPSADSKSKSSDPNGLEEYRGRHDGPLYQNSLRHVINPVKDGVLCHNISSNKQGNCISLGLPFPVSQKNESPENCLDDSSQPPNKEDPASVSQLSSVTMLMEENMGSDYCFSQSCVSNPHVTTEEMKPSTLAPNIACSLLPETTALSYQNVKEKSPGNVSSNDVMDIGTADNPSMGPGKGRIIKKCMHRDMIYEGDGDWEGVVHEQSLFENASINDSNTCLKVKQKLGSLAGIESVDGSAAAVAAGLKAFAVDPIEKIKFKDILKRKDGLQEYLECRNIILGLWGKDVNHVLHLEDCGVSGTPADSDSHHASLIREVFNFLDSRGYINVGIALEKTIPSASYLGLPGKSVSEQIQRESVADALDPVLDAEDIKSRKSPVPSLDSGYLLDVGAMDSTGCTSLEQPLSIEVGRLDLIVAPRSVTGTQMEGEKENRLNRDHINVSGLPSDAACTFPSIVRHFEPDSSHCPAEIKSSVNMDCCEGDMEKITYQGTYCASAIDSLETISRIKPDLDVCKRIIVVGAGPAGLAAACHLQRHGFSVTVIEARDRIGGRVYTDRSSLSVPVDLGASIITGVEADVATERRPDPSSLLCKQLGLELTVLNSDCPLYDVVNGNKVPSDLDQALEAEFNSLLDDMVVLVAQNGETAMRMSLEEGLEFALLRRRLGQSASEARQFDHRNGLYEVENVDGHVTFPVDHGFITDDRNLDVDVMSPLDRRVMDWHLANLEYGCAAMLSEVSLPCWNQDDEYGGFGGAHCMIKGGYSTVMESIGDGLNIHLNHVVDEIMYDIGDSDGEGRKAVKVVTSNGVNFFGDAVLITVPLGCLKAKAIRFSPDLPQWKHDAIERLGFGVLNKVVLEFREVFWDDTVDYFGVTAEETALRGQCFMFWNVKKTVGAPVLIALVVGRAAINGQNNCTSILVMHAVKVLRKLFGESSVPDPIASVVTNWGMDPFSRGAYSFVAKGASGKDYDILGRPVANCLFFAGEATCKEHPDTVGGAMLSGVREAVRIMDILTSGKDYAAEMDAIEAVQRLSTDERSEATDFSKRFDARHALATKETLLRDMFSSARTTSGRLYLAKELLHLPLSILKSFTGSKEGLSTLNSWICDSLGKNATQLLRHCVRLLVLVSTDLLAVRSSGIGRTVKEKVCMHTSRDIRAVASQLVSMWIDVFRKEKASNGSLKLLKQPTGLETSKNRSRDLARGKPLPHTDNGAFFSKAVAQVSRPVGNRSPSKANHKRADKKAAIMNCSAAKKHENPAPSGGITSSLDSKVANRIVMSEEESEAFAAAEAARAAAHAAAEAFALSEVKSSAMPELPKIPSFYRFARGEHDAQMDESEFRRKWSGLPSGRRDCISDIDSRNCRVRDWPIDFSTNPNTDHSKMSGDNSAQRSGSNEVAYPLNFREHSEESEALDSRFVRAWVDTDAVGNGGVKDSLAIERWQSQAMCADADFFNSLHAWDEGDSNKTFKWPPMGIQKGSNASSSSHGAVKKTAIEEHPRGAHHIKQGIVDYVASLLMPLYKARKLDKDGYKSIMKKTATKVMELCTEEEKVMTVPEFLDHRRKNKIRSFVDKLIERHMLMSLDPKS